MGGMNNGGAYGSDPNLGYDGGFNNRQNIAMQNNPGMMGGQ